MVELEAGELKEAWGGAAQMGEMVKRMQGVKSISLILARVF